MENTQMHKNMKKKDYEPEGKRCQRQRQLLRLDSFQAILHRQANSLFR